MIEIKKFLGTVKELLLSEYWAERFKTLFKKQRDESVITKFLHGRKIRKLVEGRIRSSTTTASVLMLCYSHSDFMWRSVKLAIHLHMVQSLEAHGTKHSQSHKSPLHYD